jgi:hypothetical protein
LTPITPGYVPSRSFQVESVRPPEIDAVRILTIFRTIGWRIAIRASLVTSRALDTWPGASRPSGRTKCVSRRPRARALAFIIDTNRGTLPWPTYDASAHAASLAL